MDQRFAPISYFDAISSEMQRQGFHFLAKVSMKNDEHPYHVDSFGKVRETRMFFVVPGKAFIVLLELHEFAGQKRWDGTLDRDYFQSYWSGHIFIEHNRTAMYMAEFEKWFQSRDTRKFMDEPEISVDLTDYFELSPYRPGWSAGNCNALNYSFEQLNPYGRERLDPHLVTECFGAMLHQVDPFLAERFTELQVTSFAWYYTFPGAEPAFWKKFPLARLRPIAPRIFGTTFA